VRRLLNFAPSKSGQAKEAGTEQQHGSGFRNGIGIVYQGDSSSQVEVAITISKRSGVVKLPGVHSAIAE